MTSNEIRRKNFKRNKPTVYAIWEKLPEYHPGMVISCPTKNLDGSEIAADDVRGCGSTDVYWEGPGDGYTCPHCGIFFADYAANPPHRRED